ncbi:transcriptional regulator, TetR family [Halarchaeum acidiphilum MH1-52-1]|uniref:Transcriptional regulator, TetR family n=1 Tax=Halarchaeum acidiphilum MH1-52-1 TaxID=1261545 RepID=U2YRK3_9EURY|nr:TetR family transcriptional regulator C-terminal domain-containing protein [Halarchaeum acidiphilum]GAD51630.1 transcriptional regulator, TetR family [Halarchaeum acidiphilum MH1-52-1]
MADIPSDRERTDVEDAIMRATYRALRERGYADLTMRAIAEEYGKTTAAIHYHYDTKDDLLVAFLEYLLDRFLTHVHDVETTDPEARLDDLLDGLLVEREDDYDLIVALLEMRAQAPYHESIREQLARNDEYLRYLLRTVIADGVDRGVFDDVDPETAAGTLLTIVNGARTRFVVLDDSDVLHLARDAADAYVEDILEAE